VTDPLLWNIACVAESEMTSHRENNANALQDFPKLFGAPVPFRFYICRAAQAGQRAERFRNVLDNALRVRAAEGQVRVGAQIAVLMVVTRGQQRTPPWGGLYTHAANVPTAFTWQELQAVG
jgi:hypothetical protein